MGKGLPRSMSRGAARLQEMIKQEIRIKDLQIEVDGATGIGWGTVVVGDLPAGTIFLLGAVSRMQFRGPTSANLVDTWTGNYAFGSAPTADSTLNGAEVDIIPSTAISAATAELSPVTRGASTALSILNNENGSLEINLGLLIADASIDGNDIMMSANGTLTLLYSVL
jgi:hypothetical protein